MRFPFRQIFSFEDATRNFEQIETAFGLPVYASPPLHPGPGQGYFDSALGKPGWWDGVNSVWWYAQTSPVTPAGIGAVASADRPSAVLASNLTAINTQTTLQSITGLQLAISASATEIWLVKWWLLIQAANATMDFKWGLSVPTACTAKGGSTTSAVGGWAMPVPATGGTVLLTQATTGAEGTANGAQGLLIAYIVFGGGTAGNVIPQYAQNTSDAGNLQILAGSAMEATKLAA